MVSLFLFSFLLIPLKRNLSLQPIGKAHNSFPKSVGFFFSSHKTTKVALLGNQSFNSHLLCVFVAKKAD